MTLLSFKSRLKSAIEILRGAETSKLTYGKMAVRDRLYEVKSKIPNTEPLIVDGGGAHSGAITDRLLNYYPSAHVHAFEPIPHLANYLRAKYANHPNIIVHEKALGATSKTITFHQLNNLAASSMLYPSEIKKKYHGKDVDISNELTVEQVKLDDIVRGNIDILKFDLQGYELEALKGAKQLLSRTKLILIEVEFVPLYKEQPLFGDVDVFLRNQGLFLLNLYELWTHPDGQLTSGDAIYLNSRYFSS